MIGRASSASLQDLPDAELVGRFRAGDDDALEVLLSRHRETLYRFCCHLVSNREDAEDICQESLTRAVAHVDSLESDSAFRSWLFRIARNLSIDAFRSRRRTCPLPDEEIIPPPLHVDGPQDRVEIGEEYQTVAEALARLAKSHQQVLMLREVEGLSYAEIAERLDVSQSAVEALLFRARRRLREEYGRNHRALPGLVLLAGMREVILRMAEPLASAPPFAGKVAVTAAVLGAAVYSAPSMFPSDEAGRPILHQAASIHLRSAPRLAFLSEPSRPARPVTSHPGAVLMAAPAAPRSRAVLPRSVSRGQQHPTARLPGAFRPIRSIWHTWVFRSASYKRVNRLTPARHFVRAVRGRVRVWHLAGRSGRRAVRRKTPFHRVQRVRAVVSRPVPSAQQRVKAQSPWALAVTTSGPIVLHRFIPPVSARQILARVRGSSSWPHPSPARDFPPIVKSMSQFPRAAASRGPASDVRSWAAATQGGLSIVIGRRGESSPGGPVVGWDSSSSAVSVAPIREGGPAAGVPTAEQNPFRPVSPAPFASSGSAQARAWGGYPGGSTPRSQPAGNTGQSVVQAPTGPSRP